VPSAGELLGWASRSLLVEVAAVPKTASSAEPPAASIVTIPVVGRAIIAAPAAYPDPIPPAGATVGVAATAAPAPMVVTKATAAYLCEAAALGLAEMTCKS
jgi:hypothetical protein